MIERVLQKDLWAKIAAVMLALIIWLRVFNDQNPLETRTVYLELAFSQDKIVDFQSTDSVAVTVQGRSSLLDQLEENRPAIQIDTSGLPTGNNQLPVSFASPISGVNVIDINPKSFIVDLDVPDSKMVDVKVQTTGIPNEEWEALPAVSGVANVKVTGPSKNVAKVVAVVGLVDIAGEAGSVDNAQVRLTAVDSQSNEVMKVEVVPPEIPVSVPMNKRPPAKDVPIQPRTSGSPQEGYRVKSVYAEPSSVRIRADASVAQNLSSITTRPVDVSDRSETFTYQAYLDIPTSVSPDFQRVTVTVEIEEEIVKKTFRNVIVQFESLPAGFKWDLNPTTVDVTIRGRSDVLEGIDEDDVKAVIDPSWVKAAGSYNMPVNIKGLPDSVRFDEIVPPQVILDLEVR